MNNLKNAIYLIGTGLTLAFTLIGYAHVNFATKGEVKEARLAVESYKAARDREIDMLSRWMERVEGKLDRVIEGDN